VELEKLHDWFAENIKAAYADDEEKLKIRLEKIEVSRQIRLKTIPFRRVWVLLKRKIKESQ
jgi:hypothetical protein